jgi:hypothetical protein
VIATKIATMLGLTFFRPVVDAHLPTRVDVVGAVGRFFDITA